MAELTTIVERERVEKRKIDVDSEVVRLYGDRVIYADRNNYIDNEGRLIVFYNPKNIYHQN